MALIETGRQVAAGRQDQSPLDDDAGRRLRAAAYAETLGAGPLEPFMRDPAVEEIDVNSAASTFVSYSDGRKIAVGRLWASDDDLAAYQNRLTLSMGVSEARLDEQSPMVTLQSPDGSRVVMVLGGQTRAGVSTHPRIAIRRFTVHQIGLPYHWGVGGDAVVSGDAANDLLGVTLDPNVQIQESKAGSCDIQPGRRPHG